MPLSSRNGPGTFPLRALSGASRAGCVRLLIGYCQMACPVLKIH